MPTFPTKNSERLYYLARGCLSFDMSPVENELGCAESVNHIHEILFGEQIGGGTSTLLLFEALQKRKDFVLVDEYEIGAIIISPTGLQRSGFLSCFGHVGICGQWQIMSNNSKSHKWDIHLTITSWKKYFVEKNGFPVYYFRKL